MNAAKQAPTRVFVVDDEQVIASTLATILRQQGYDATPFTDPLQAQEACREQAPDILVTDVVMPKITGIELALYMRQHHSTCHVLLISGQAATSTLVASAAAQGHHFRVVAKPIHPMNLLQELQKISGQPCF